MTALTRLMKLDTVLSAAAAGVFVRPAFAGRQVGAAARPRIIVLDVNETSSMSARWRPSSSDSSVWVRNGSQTSC